VAGALNQVLVELLAIRRGNDHGITKYEAMSDVVLSGQSDHSGTTSSGEPRTARHGPPNTVTMRWGLGRPLSTRASCSIVRGPRIGLLVPDERTSPRARKSSTTLSGTTRQGRWVETNSPI